MPRRDLDQTGHIVAPVAERVRPGVGLARPRRDITRRLVDSVLETFASLQESAATGAYAPLTDMLAAPFRATVISPRT